MTPAEIVEILVEGAIERAVPFFLDTCNVVNLMSVPDGFGGQTKSRVTVASNVPCLWEASRDLPVTINAGAATSITRHQIIMQVDDADVRTIGPDYEIVVAARDDTPELTFYDPRVLGGTMESLLTVSAKLRQ